MSDRAGSPGLDQQTTRTKGHTYVEISDKVWELAELRFQEHGAVATQIEALEEEGFEITRNVAGMPTAFAAEDGSGYADPRLPGRVRRAGRPQPGGRCRRADARSSPARPGQGCGHNMLGPARCWRPCWSVTTSAPMACPGPSATTAAPAKRAAPARRSWPAMASSTTWTPRSAGTPARSTPSCPSRRWLTSRSTSASRDRRPTRLARRTWAGAPSTPSSSRTSA